jgi:hypothetical protein
LGIDPPLPCAGRKENNIIAFKASSWQIQLAMGWLDTGSIYIFIVFVKKHSD